MTKVNLGVFTEIATEKADRDLRNIDLTKTDIVIEYQEPTEENDYTWYRLYASGWVEQGGFVRKNSMDTNNYTAVFPIAMQNLNFTITMAHLDSSFNSYELLCINRDTKYITLGMTGSTWQGAGWQVSGKADMTGHEVLPSKKAIDENDHRVIDFQKPTAENGYKWYRKYADGWVEQGGISQAMSAGAGLANEQTINLLIKMSDTSYSIQMGAMGSWASRWVDTITTSSFVLHQGNRSGSGSNTQQTLWQVSGLYATE